LFATPKGVFQPGFLERDYLFAGVSLQAPRSAAIL
jgi:hypothetical protein